MSRGEILQRVRRANGFAGTVAAADAEWTEIPRAYRREGAAGREAALLLLEDRLRDYDATVMRAAPADVASAVAQLLAKRGVRRMVVPAGVCQEWLADRFSFAVDEGLSVGDLDRFDGVLTGATLAIAETGTIVLRTVAGQGRRAMTLVPDYHLCVVRSADVVATVPEAMDRLRRAEGFGMTFVSGPSATADIEMTRIKGVHGPRFLDVVLVMEDDG